VGNPLFRVDGIDVADLIAKNLGARVLPAVLSRSTPGTRTAGRLTAGTNPTRISRGCRGFIDTQARQNIDGSIVADGNVVITLLGDTIEAGDVPKLEDVIQIEGSSYTIQKIARDPAAATYSCESTPR